MGPEYFVERILTSLERIALDRGGLWPIAGENFKLRSHKMQHTG